MAMVGLLIISHCDLGRELLNAAQLILGKLDNVDTVCISSTTKSEELLSSISSKIKTLDKGKGVLILTDMFGGTPSNLSLSFLQDGKVEVLTGVNLPMIIAVAQDREELNLEELGKKAQEAGRRSIALASKLLKQE